MLGGMALSCASSCCASDVGPSFGRALHQAFDRPLLRSQTAPQERFGPRAAMGFEPFVPPYLVWHAAFRQVCASIELTFDPYGHLFDARDDDE
jgi:hypothetical protein